MRRYFKKTAALSLSCWMIVQPMLVMAQSVSTSSTSFDLDAGFRPEAVLEDRDIFEIGNMTLPRLQDLLLSKGTLGTYRTKDTDGIEKSAAEIIWRIAGSYQINPRYLLALMQKEQSLVEDPHPTQKQFDWATGYGVCDSCAKDDPSIQDFKGFASQIEWAAKQHREKYLLQILGRGKTIAGISPGKLAMIDGQAIVPSNNATAMLYSYTPHIAGNLNLWRIWQRWFALQFPEGSLIHATDSGKFYLIRFGEKRRFATTSIALSMSAANKMLVASEHDLASYPDGDLIRFPNYALVETPAHVRYLLIGDKKRRFASKAVFQSLGFNTDEIIDANDSDLAAYTDGADITKSTTYPVGILAKDQQQTLWYIEDGVKHLIPHASLVSLYFKGWPAKKLTQKQSSAFTLGDPYQLHDGELVRTKESSAVYVIENGLRRPIPSGDIFEGMGWNWKNVVTLPKLVLNDYPVGDPIQLYQPSALATLPLTNPSTASTTSLTLSLR